MDNMYHVPTEPLEPVTSSEVGKRIKNIRKEKGLTQAELGRLVGLTGDRIQKYENGLRCPRRDLLKNIAAALEVSPFALADPIMSSPVGTLYALFELVDKYGLKLSASGDNSNRSISIVVPSDNCLYSPMHKWHEMYTAYKNSCLLGDEERIEAEKAYHNWLWNFPNEFDMNKVAKEQQKEQIKRKIAELKTVYEELDKESS